MRLVLLLVVCLLLGLPLAVGATPDVSPEKAREMLKLLADPELQRSIAQQGAAMNLELTVSLHRQRLLWSRQIEMPYVRTQPNPKLQTGELIVPKPTLT